MKFIEIDLTVNPTYGEILIAELAELGYDSFLETENGIKAYIDEEQFDDFNLKVLIESYAIRTSLHYSIEAIEKQNWNKEWESNFNPIEVDGQIYVRATFHEAKAFPYEIVITPKMSFGTGHHETTHQVMSLQLGIDHRNKCVLDVGTGTGILAILASKLGAINIHAFDIDEWSIENTIENIALNNTPHITASLGTIKDQEVLPYDIVIANINRNILLDEIAQYVKFMKPDGILIVSGFYEHDADDIETAAGQVGLKKSKMLSKNNWAAIVFKA